MLARRRRLSNTDNTWPGFVDALSTLLLVIIFLLVVFFLSQFVLSQAVSKKDEALDSLQVELDELRMLLNIERVSSVKKDEKISSLLLSLDQSESEKAALNVEIMSLTARAEDAERQILDLRQQVEDANSQIRSQAEDLAATIGVLSEKDAYISRLEQSLAEQSAEREVDRSQIIVLGKDLEKQTRLTDAAQAQVEILNQQLTVLRAQLASLQDALDASDAKNKEQQVQIVDLGRRLNTALASKVQELKRYRSEFFGRLKETLGDRPDVQIVGDRFVFQSEVLFSSGSATLGMDGQSQLDMLATTLLEIADKIPADLPWILRIDGHTDSIPINNNQFRNNWALSGERALSVVEYLIRRGIPPQRLAAAGFGEYHPIDMGTDEIALRRNRRIEIKLTER